MFTYLQRLWSKALDFAAQAVMVVSMAPCAYLFGKQCAIEARRQFAALAEQEPYMAARLSEIQPLSRRDQVIDVLCSVGRRVWCAVCWPLRVTGLQRWAFYRTLARVQAELGDEAPQFTTVVEDLVARVSCPV